MPLMADGRLTGQSALILGLGQFCCRTICGMLQAQFQLGSKGLVYLEMTCSLLRNDSTEERSNSAFLTKILAGKLPIICRGFSSQAQSPELSMTCRGYCFGGATQKVP